MRGFKRAASWLIGVATIATAAPAWSQAQSADPTTNPADATDDNTAVVTAQRRSENARRIFPRFYIRGLGNIHFYLGASQPVEVIQDDVVEEHVVLKSNPACDIAQIEVPKGPQVSLFGRNTTAGIVKFDSAQPTGTWQGQGSVSYGRFNSVKADAASAVR